VERSDICRNVKPIFSWHQVLYLANSGFVAAGSLSPLGEQGARKGKRQNLSWFSIKVELAIVGLPVSCRQKLIAMSYYLERLLPAHGVTH
jgi:hypothetical protein